MDSTERMSPEDSDPGRIDGRYGLLIQNGCDRVSLQFRLCLARQTLGRTGRRIDLRCEWHGDLHGTSHSVLCQAVPWRYAMSNVTSSVFFKDRETYVFQRMDGGY